MTVVSATTKRAQQYRLPPEVIELFPAQGGWTEEQYLALTDDTRRLVEFTDGYIEVLPMPTERHQDIQMFIYLVLRAIAARIGGKVYVAPLRVRVREGKFREPDILFLRSAADPRRDNRYWFGADLVVEVVSPDDPERDTVEKRQDYAEAAIPEYWIVNPLNQTITVLVLDGDVYREHGIFHRSESAVSLVLPNFQVDVNAALDAV